MSLSFHDQRPDAVNRRRGAVGHARALPERRHGPRLQPFIGVDQHAPCPRHAPVVIDQRSADRVRAVEHVARHVRRRDRRDARKVEERLPHVLQVAFRGGEVVGEVEERGEDPGGGGEVEVRRHTGRRCGVEGVDTEEVQHDGGDGREGAEEHQEDRYGEADHVEYLLEAIGVRLGVVRGREAVEGDGRVGSSDARDRGGGRRQDVGGGGGRRGRDSDDDGVATAEEELGELHHGGEVADAEAGVQHHGLATF
uniref:Uncharacterized protein n=1 Tax=Oryza brachyantha TaxID=4533 RepID=J3M929_ORYBR